MSNSVKVIVAAVVLAVVGLGVYTATRPKSTTPSATPPQSSNTPAASTSNSTESVVKPAANAGEVAATISYDGSAFEPASVTIKAGQSVKVVNNSQRELDFESDPHPEHTAEPELNAGDIDPGQSKTFTATKAGTWGYHNHLNNSQKGTVIVQ